MDDRSAGTGQNTPENGPERLSDAPVARTRSGALEMAWEALTAARAAVDVAADAVDRMVWLDQIAARWIELADHLDPRDAGKAPGRPVERLLAPPRYAGVGEGSREAQAGAQGRTGKVEPRTLNFGPDMPFVSLWHGTAYAMGSMWTDSHQQVWMVVGAYRTTGEPWLEARGPNENTGRWSIGRVIEAFGPPTRVWGGPTVYAFGDGRYPLGTMWTDRDGDRWRVAGPDDRGELRMVDESTKDPEFMPQYAEGDVLYYSPLAEVLQRWGPLVQADDDAWHTA